MQTGGDVTQFTPCTHDVTGSVCTGEEGLLLPRDGDGMAQRGGGGGGGDGPKPKRDAA